MSKNAALKQRTAYLSIISNTTLVVLKLIVGIYVGAVSLISEALHSGVDLIAALIAFWAVRKSVTPPDMEHDYGHGKYENLSAAVEAVLIVAAALGIVGLRAFAAVAPAHHEEQRTAKARQNGEKGENDHEFHERIIWCAFPDFQTSGGFY